jgi:hypothetical protein
LSEVKNQGSRSVARLWQLALYSIAGIAALTAALSAREQLSALTNAKAMYITMTILGIWVIMEGVCAFARPSDGVVRIRRLGVKYRLMFGGTIALVWFLKIIPWDGKPAPLFDADKQSAAPPTSAMRPERSGLESPSDSNRSTGVDGQRSSESDADSSGTQVDNLVWSRQGTGIEARGEAGWSVPSKVLIAHKKRMSIISGNAECSGIRITFRNSSEAPLLTRMMRIAITDRSESRGAVTSGLLEPSARWLVELPRCTDDVVFPVIGYYTPDVPLQVAPGDAIGVDIVITNELMRDRDGWHATELDGVYRLTITFLFEDGCAETTVILERN